MRHKTILAVVLITLAMSWVVACNPSTLDAQELVTIQVVGADGYGTLSLRSNRARIAEIIREEGESVGDTDEKQLHRLFVREAAMNSLIFSSDKTMDLKNGDEIVIHATYDEELAKLGGVRFKNLKFTYVVEGLEKARPIDIDTELDLAFVGFESRGTAHLALSGDLERYREHFDFIFVTPNTYLSNGTTVDVHVRPDNTALTAQGRIAEEKVLTFTVSNLKPLESVDVFENVVLSFDGVSDFGNASIDTMRLPIDWIEPGTHTEPPLSFSATPTTNLANGDKVTVVATVNRDWFADRGLFVEVFSKDFTVGGLKDYPRNLDRVDLMPLFNKLQEPLREDIQMRLLDNMWNEDFRVGNPVSRWDIQDKRGVVRIYYGYLQSNRADNFVALIYKLEVSGICVEATPYQSRYEVGAELSETLYLVYMVDSIMHNSNRVDDFEEFSLKFHSDLEPSAISQFKEEYGGAGVVVVDATVPEQVKFKFSDE